MPHTKCSCKHKKTKSHTPSQRQTEYRKFFAKHRKAGKTAKEIGAAWRSSKK